MKISEEFIISDSYCNHVKAHNLLKFELNNGENVIHEYCLICGTKGISLFVKMGSIEKGYFVDRC